MSLYEVFEKKPSSTNEKLQDDDHSNKTSTEAKDQKSNIVKKGDNLNVLSAATYFTPMRIKRPGLLSKPNQNVAFKSSLSGHHSNTTTPTSSTENFPKTTTTPSTTSNQISSVANVANITTTTIKTINHINNKQDNENKNTMASTTGSNDHQDSLDSQESNLRMGQVENQKHHTTQSTQQKSTFPPMNVSNNISLPSSIQFSYEETEVPGLIPVAPGENDYNPNVPNDYQYIKRQRRELKRKQEERLLKEGIEEMKQKILEQKATKQKKANPMNTLYGSSSSQHGSFYRNMNNMNDDEGYVEERDHQDDHRHYDHYDEERIEFSNNNNNNNNSQHNKSSFVQLEFESGEDAYLQRLRMSGSGSQ